MRSLLLHLPLLALLGCRGPAPEDGRSVQDSAEGAPRTTISLNRQLTGRFRNIAPSCVGRQYTVRTPPVAPSGSGLLVLPGDVVEFRNFLPDVPTNVTALDAPGGAVMFSPSLVRPYNLGEEGGEVFSAWRYQFAQPGVYEFFDTNSGDPGRRVVDAYYGTVSFIGESDAPRGVVCVDPVGCVASSECLLGIAPEGTLCCACPGVCCTTDAQCAADRACQQGQCVDPLATP